MKLPKRVNYKKVTKKGKNGKKSNRVKQSKKRQNRKTNKKTQNGGETVPETIECETQIIVEKPALFLRKDGSNTGFFYVRQDIELPEANLKTGSVVELEDGILIEHGGSGSSAAAPMAKKLFKKIIDRHTEREKIRISRKEFNNNVERKT